MPNQRYYKLISLNINQLIKPPNGNETSPWECNQTISPSLFNSTLVESLDTIKLSEVCKQLQIPFTYRFTKDNLFKELKSIPKKEICLGYQIALINLELPIARKSLYSNGFNFNGSHYVRYKRSASAAKDGKCLFILESLYETMIQWSYCGLSPNTPLQTDFQAYISLTLSGIAGTITLPKKSILILDDVTSNFNTKAMAVTISDENKPSISASETCEVSAQNIIWDGQAMLDSSAFELANGFEDRTMLLLRNRFFKTCAFKTNLQQWFRANDIKKINQLNGYTTARKIEDIKLVITTSSLKYCKFFDNLTTREKYIQWLKNFGKSDLTFGIVKADKPTKYFDGKMCRTSYQFLGTLGLTKEETYNLLAPSIEYLNNIKGADLSFFKHYCKMFASNINADFSGKTSYQYQVSNIALSITNQFANTPIYRRFFYNQIASLKTHIKRGELLVDGTYATMFGNCIEFLYATIHKGYDPNKTTPTLNGEPIRVLNDNEVYTTFFEAGTDLCAYRSPHITMGNCFLAKTTDNEFIKEYFPLSSSIICVNAINHNIMNRLNGADYDSDFILITDNPVLVTAVKRQYDLFAVPMLVECPAPTSCPSSAYNSPEMLAKIDNTIANNLIGVISNLAFVLNNIFWDRYNRYDWMDKSDAATKNNLSVFIREEASAYYDLLSSLAILSNLEIDKAKRDYRFRMEDLVSSLREEISLLMIGYGIPPSNDEKSNEAKSKKRTLKREPRVQRANIPRTLIRYKIPWYLVSILGTNAEGLLDNFEDSEDGLKRARKPDGIYLNLPSKRSYPFKCALGFLNQYSFDNTRTERDSIIDYINLIKKPNTWDTNTCRKVDFIKKQLTITQNHIDALQAKRRKGCIAKSDKNETQQAHLNTFFEFVSKYTLSSSAIYSLLSTESDFKKDDNSVKKHKMALLFAGLLFSKESPLLRMLYEANKDEETFELVPAEESDIDTVSLYGHLYKKQKIAKKELPFIKPLLEEQ